MKAPSVIAKNLKLLFRSKETAFTIVFGPLLIILLVSAAYTGGSGDTVLVGTYAPNYTGLADSVITALKDQGYQVNVFANETQCVDRIKTGQLHTCIIFPEDFRIKGNETNTVTFAVDYSRINLVYQIIDGLSKEFDLQSTQISQGKVGDVLARVALAQTTLHEQMAQANTIDKDLSDTRANLAAGKNALGNVDVNVSFTDLVVIKGNVAGLNTVIGDMQTRAQEGLSAAEDLLTQAKRDCDNCSQDYLDEIDASILELENASNEIGKISKKVPEQVAEVNHIIDTAAASMRQVQDRFARLVNASEKTQQGLGESINLIDDALSRLTTLRGQLQHIDESLQSSIGLTSEGVASPITTRIEAVNAEQNNLAFTYPYILMLIIMFLGLMLSSMLIVMDKTSTAAFRNFTTATRDEYYILMSFVTTFIILLVQTLVILLLSRWFLGQSFLNNFGVSLVIIFVAITLFSFLGMIIGYVAGTAEAAMISSLSIGSILLFISNLVLPLEAMNRVVQVLSVYNPYVVLSELLKQSMLFSLKFRYVPGKIGLLVAAIMVLFLAVLVVQRSFKRRYFQRRSKDLAMTAFAPARVVKPLILGKRQVKDLFDLLAVLDAMTRAEFEAVIAPDKNPIEAWVRNEVQEKRLARRLDTRSKERMILALDTFLKKQTKRLAKG